MEDIAERWATETVDHFTEGEELIPYTLYEAPLGDVLLTFLDHQKVWFWTKWTRRWKDTDARLRQILNQCQVVQWYERK